jgi:hypothetical protein
MDPRTGVTSVSSFVKRRRDGAGRQVGRIDDEVRPADDLVGERRHVVAGVPLGKDLVGIDDRCEKTTSDRSLDA